jgi:hypothetical protein
LDNEYVVGLALKPFGDEVSCFVQKLLAVPSEPLLCIEVHLLLKLSLGGHHNSWTGPITTMVDVDVIGIQVEISQSFLTKNISFFHISGELIILIYEISNKSSNCNLVSDRSFTDKLPIIINNLSLLMQNLRR